VGFATADWYAKQSPDRFMFHVGEAVVDMDPTAHTVTTSKDRTINYDYCILVCDFYFVHDYAC
jgi:nitrite reductase (NAD(P)H)